MKKTLLICATGAILQMCFFTGCSDKNLKDTQDSSQGTSVETSHAEMSDSDTITNTLKEIVLPEMDIEDDSSEMSPTGATQSDNSDTNDKSSNDNRAVTTKATATSKETITTTKVTARITAPAVTTKNNTSKETTAKAVSTAVTAESVTAATKIDVIELPEVEFD
ncbi:MAG: hypothetical protein ACI4JB_03505 [Porcipelethomonas sp.]